VTKLNFLESPGNDVEPSRAQIYSYSTTSITIMRKKYTFII